MLTTDLLSCKLQVSQESTTESGCASKLASSISMTLAHGPVNSGSALGHYEATAADILRCMQIRTSIKSLFPKRDCFALVRPMEDEQQLAHLENVSTSQLRPQFQKVYHIMLTLSAVFAGLWRQEHCSAGFAFSHASTQFELEHIPLSPVLDRLTHPTIQP